MRTKLSLIFIGQLILFNTWAQDLDPLSLQAKKLLERLSGTKVPANHALIQPMAERLRVGDRLGAAELATTHPQFLNSTVKLMALKLSTREESFSQSLNDFAALMVGVARDQSDAREILTGNFYYAADPAKLPAGVTVRSDIKADLLKSNNHYSDLDKPEIDLGQVLRKVPGQQIVDGSDNVVSNPDAAGVLTSRAFMGAHVNDGTNRRPVEYLFREFMCVAIEEWSDTRVTDLRIGRDIDRFPGNDHMKFLTSCKGCHTQMDSLRGAFARWDFQGGRSVNSKVASRPGGFDARGVNNRLNKNGDVFPSGYVTTDDSFFNNSRGPANEALFGWRGSVLSGSGVKDLGVMISNSKRFSQCMSKRVYDAVCRTNIDIKAHHALISTLAGRFEETGYNLKQLFKEVSVLPLCLGE